MLSGFGTASVRRKSQTLTIIVFELCTDVLEFLVAVPVDAPAEAFDLVQEARLDEPVRSAVDARTALSS